jgi:hypothetical protein
VSSAALRCLVACYRQQLTGFTERAHISAALP